MLKERSQTLKAIYCIFLSYNIFDKAKTGAENKSVVAKEGKGVEKLGYELFCILMMQWLQDYTFVKTQIHIIARLNF